MFFVTFLHSVSTVRNRESQLPGGSLGRNQGVVMTAGLGGGGPGGTPSMSRPGYVAAKDLPPPPAHMLAHCTRAETLPNPRQNHQYG